MPWMKFSCHDAQSCLNLTWTVYKLHETSKYLQLYKMHRVWTIYFCNDFNNFFHRTHLLSIQFF
jgi:hypothetical protein